MESKQSSRNRLSYWQLIFSKSKVNGAPYNDERLAVSHWEWPTATYLRGKRSQNESLSAAGERQGAASKGSTGAGV